MARSKNNTPAREGADSGPDRGTNVGHEPGTNRGEQAEPNREQRSEANGEKHPESNRGRQAAQNQRRRAASNREQRPTTNRGEKAEPNREQRPTTNREQRPTTNRGEKAEPNREQQSAESHEHGRMANRGQYSGANRGRQSASNQGRDSVANPRNRTATNPGQDRATGSGRDKTNPGTAPFRAFWEDAKKRFNLYEGSAPQQEVVAGITDGIFFRGANMWILMFATMVASLGLNVNSTAVIIGAMLISPLMGPIMGFGLSLGINDFELTKKSLKNFGFMVATAIVTATLFFLFVPISGAQSELLARTQPTIFDVLIAFFGGAAGVVAYTRKDRTVTVISGVAIATALMPPLCTAGYGIATAQWQFFGGALYLFVINAIFIALATYAIIRVLKYSKKTEVDRRTERRVKRLMWTIIVITVLPSIYIAFRLIDKSVFESNVDRFVEAEFNFEDTRVLERECEYFLNTGKNPCSVTLMLYGETLPEATIENIRRKMPAYDLEDVALVVKQAGGNSELDFTPLQQGYAQLLNEKNRRIAELENRLRLSSGGDASAMRQTVEEFRAIVPQATQVSVSRQPVWSDGGTVADTVVMCLVRSASGLSGDDMERARRWLQAKNKTDNVKIYVER